MEKEQMINLIAYHEQQIKVINTIDELQKRIKKQQTELNLASNLINYSYHLKRCEILQKCIDRLIDKYLTDI